jgi:hypothetical protein
MARTFSVLRSWKRYWRAASTLTCPRVTLTRRLSGLDGAQGWDKGRSCDSRG